MQEEAPWVIKHILESGLAVYVAAGSGLIHVKKIVSVPVVTLSVKENGIADNVTAGTNAMAITSRQNYLQKKVESQAKNTQVITRLKTGLPQKYVQEAIGTQNLVIMEYLAQLMVRRFQDAIDSQMTVNNRKTPRLSQM